MKTFYLFSFLTFILLSSGTASAKDFFVIEEGGRAALGGAVKAIRFNNLYVMSGGKEYEVGLEKLNLELKADEVFTPGQQVLVRGLIVRSAKPEIKISAENILQADGASQDDPLMQLLLLEEGADEEVFDEDDHIERKFED